MTDLQLKKCPSFDRKEIEATGGNVEGINFQSFLKLQLLRNAVSCPIYFQENGINSGVHKSKEHPDGKAFDIFTPKKIDFATAQTWIYTALKIGFTGIGFYHNGVMYSFHFDDGPNIRMWIMFKKTNAKKWIEGEFINDPKQYS